MINWTQVFGFLLNGVDINYLTASVLISIIGGALHSVMYAFHGAKNNEKTPPKFNVWYFIGHNIGRFFATSVLIFIYCAYSPKLIGENVTLIGAFLIGFFIDGILVLLLNNSTSVFKLISGKVLTLLNITPKK
jgi:flagellar motor component MotA